MLKDIAEDIGMHLSTVSRVVNRKYAHAAGRDRAAPVFYRGMSTRMAKVSTRIIKLKIKID
jgi:DNA-directed RNA polymerase specialized sigma54-like protein